MILAEVQVHGYILAGGRSSRMGEEKGALKLEGRSLLDRAIDCMGVACPWVTVVGSRTDVPAGVGQVTDRYPGCGPMGGMEAALRDCQERGAAYALFLPVDMPFLPEGLLRALKTEWAKEPTRVALAVVDGVPQPLVSALHVEMLPALQASLERGEYKLQPALRKAAEDRAGAMGESVDPLFVKTELHLEADGTIERVGAAGWMPTPAEWARRATWFANLNTPADMRLATELRERDKD